MKKANTKAQKPLQVASTTAVASSRGKRPRDDAPGAKPGAHQQVTSSKHQKRRQAPAALGATRPSSVVLITGGGSGDDGATAASQEPPAVVKIGANRLAGINATLWKKDPIYRLVREIPRSDMVHFIKCRLSNETKKAKTKGQQQQHQQVCQNKQEGDISKAKRYMEENLLLSEEAVGDGVGGLKDVRLQLHAPFINGIQLFLPNVLGGCRYTLRKLDLSRNTLSCGSSSNKKSRSDAEDDGEEGGAIRNLISALDLANNSGRSTLEVLDLSYNMQLGNAGASELLKATQRNSVLKALLLKHTGVNSEGCTAISSLLRMRVEPLALGAGDDDDGNDDSEGDGNEAAGGDDGNDEDDTPAAAVETPVPQSAGRRKPKAELKAAQKAAGLAAEESTNKKKTRRPRSTFSGSATTFGLPMFFLNLNENLIGSSGLSVLRMRLPDFVSLSVVAQKMSKSTVVEAAAKFKAAPIRIPGFNIIEPVAPVIVEDPKVEDDEETEELPEVV